MDIAAWLQGLGLARYRQAFLDHEVDALSLPHLTAEDLEAIGVTAIGHRRRLLQAIAILTQETAAGEPVGEQTSAGVSSKSGLEAERRQLTVLFCDLAGSTALSSRLDPEDMREVIRTYQNTVAGVIARFEGFVAKLMGDGVLAYFGYPRAHEDEAERAVRAGLALVEAVRGLETAAGEPLAARIGIATGLVVVGDLVGEGAAQERAVVGDTPNLAARLQALAEPGQVVIAQATRRLTGGGFDLADLGPQTLKGLADPVEAFAVLGEQALESRFEAHSSSVLPMVGREQELALLRERWQQAKAGEGQMVLLGGEAGIGKSRISRALLDAVAEEPHVRLRYQCSPYHGDSALWPVIQQLGHAAGFVTGEPPETRLDKLEALLARGVDAPQDVAPLFAALLGMDEGRYGRLDLTPPQRRSRTLQALVDQLIGLAARQPVLVVLEDAHWIDPTTLEMVESALDRVAGARVLLLVTARPTFSHRFGGHPIVTRLVLNRLGHAQTAVVMARIAGGKPLPEALIAEIAARTDGVPLYVEEMTKAVLESGTLRETEDAYLLEGSLSRLAIPTSLHDSLMARLDRLQPVKEVAQTAAVIGRAFEHETIAALSPLPEAELTEAMRRLVEAELVFRRGTPPDANYLFKHALVRDAAYESLLKARRLALHARLVEILERRGEAAPEVVAQHAEAAGLVEKAVGYWDQAARLAIGRSASVEAVGHLRRALDLLSDLPASRERAQRELKLEIGIGAQLAVTKGYAAPDVEKAFGRARTLCQELGDAPELPPVLFGLWRYYNARARYAEAREMAEQCLALATKAEDAALILLANHALGWPLYALGRFNQAREHIEATLRLYEPSAHRALAFVYGTDLGPHSRGLLSWQLWLLGWPDRALAESDRALAEAAAGGHKVTLGISQFYAAALHELRREPQRVAEVAADCVATCREQGLEFYLAVATIIHGWALVQQGDAGAIASIREGLDAYLKTGALLCMSYHRAKLADAYRTAGQTQEALSVLDEALAFTEQTDERFFEADLHRCRGELTLLIDAGAAAEAEACFHRALDVARRVEARSLELRAATSLARLWRDGGKRAEARDLLAPVYSWFTEGFDTQDLKDAKSLLNQLT